MPKLSHSASAVRQFMKRHRKTRRNQGRYMKRQKFSVGRAMLRAGLVVSGIMAAWLVITPPAMASDEDLLRAATLNEQALQLYDRGCYAEAEPFYKLSLAIAEKAWGPDDLIVAAVLVHRFHGTTPITPGLRAYRTRCGQPVPG